MSTTLGTKDTTICTRQTEKHPNNIEETLVKHLGNEANNVCITMKKDVSVSIDKTKVTKHRARGKTSDVGHKAQDLSIASLFNMYG